MRGCQHDEHKKLYNKEYYLQRRDEKNTAMKERSRQKKIIAIKVKSHLEELIKINLINHSVKADFQQFIDICCNVKENKN